MAPKTEPDPAAPPADPPADPEKARLDAIEKEQAEQKATLAEHGGMLTKILDRLPGVDSGPDKNKPETGTGQPGGTPAEDIAAAVRREIAEARTRQEAEDKAKGEADWRKNVDETLEKLKPEKPPREPQTGLKGRLQRITLGKTE